MIFYFLILLIILVTLLGAVILFGDLPNYRGTVLHTLNEYLFKVIVPNVSVIFASIDRKVFNGYFSHEKTRKTIAHLSGWIIPLFYLIVFTRCISYFFKFTFSQILEYESIGKVNTNWSFRIWTIIIPIIATNYISFLLAVLSDAGHIDLETGYNNHQLQYEFPFDNLIFFENIECRTCRINKPARSKHCSSCDKCILLFDHHCIWLNNDVGYYTYRWFLLFLLSICCVFLYGGYLCYYSLKLFDSYGLNSNMYKQIASKPFFYRYWGIIKNTTFSNEVSGIMFLLCVLMFPIVFYFLGEHLWMIYLGTTTNETLKWDNINHMISNDLLFKFSPQDGSETVFLFLHRKRQDGSLQFLKLRDWEPYNSSMGGDLNRIESWDDLTNIYDRGFWVNLKHRLFPKSF